MWNTLILCKKKNGTRQYGRIIFFLLEGQRNVCIQPCVCEHVHQSNSVWNIEDALTTQYPLGLVSPPGCVTVRAPTQGDSPAVPLPSTAPQRPRCIGAAPASLRYHYIFFFNINMQTGDWCVFAKLITCLPARLHVSFPADMGQSSSSVRLRSGGSGSCRRRRLLRPGSEPLQVNVVSRTHTTHKHTHINTDWFY